MKIYQESNATHRYYYLLKYRERIKTVCLDVRKENANKWHIKALIKKICPDVVSMDFENSFEFRQDLG